MRTPALALALALAFAAPLALAQEDPSVLPEGRHSTSVGNATLSWWVGPSSSEMDEAVTSGPGTLWFAASGNATALVAFLNVTPTSPGLTIANGTLVVGLNETAGSVGSVPFETDGVATPTNVSYSFSGELYERTNGTLTLLGPVSGGGSFTVETIEVPAPPSGIPTTWLLVGGAVLVLGGGALAYGLRQRNLRRRMTGGPKRSQVMRDLELEHKLEKAKDPEQVQEIKQEIRAQEVVREKRRELQILEAKRADALKTLDLLKKRHEAGGLTKLQYDNMAAKKQADLARIEAEIAEMERAEGSGGAAA